MNPVLVDVSAFLIRPHPNLVEGRFFPFQYNAHTTVGDLKKKIAPFDRGKPHMIGINIVLRGNGGQVNGINDSALISMAASHPGFSHYQAWAHVTHGGKKSRKTKKSKKRRKRIKSRGKSRRKSRKKTHKKSRKKSRRKTKKGGYNSHCALAAEGKQGYTKVKGNAYCKNFFEDTGETECNMNTGVCGLPTSSPSSCPVCPSSSSLPSSPSSSSLPSSPSSSSPSSSSRQHRRRGTERERDEHRRRSQRDRNLRMRRLRRRSLPSPPSSPPPSSSEDEVTESETEDESSNLGGGYKKRKYKMNGG
jgi:hypothetical protein